MLQTSDMNERHDTILKGFEKAGVTEACCDAQNVVVVFLKESKILSEVVNTTLVIWSDIVHCFGRFVFFIKQYFTFLESYVLNR